MLASARSEWEAAQTGGLGLSLPANGWDLAGQLVPASWRDSSGGLYRVVHVPLQAVRQANERSWVEYPARVFSLAYACVSFFPLHLLRCPRHIIGVQALGGEAEEESHRLRAIAEAYKQRPVAIDPIIATECSYVAPQDVYVMNALFRYEAPMLVGLVVAEILTKGHDNSCVILDGAFA